MSFYLWENYRICNFLANCCDYTRKQYIAPISLSPEVYETSSKTGSRIKILYLLTGPIPVAVVYLSSSSSTTVCRPVTISLSLIRQLGIELSPLRDRTREPERVRTSPAGSHAAVIYGWATRGLHRHAQLQWFPEGPRTTKSSPASAPCTPPYFDVELHGSTKTGHKRHIERVTVSFVTISLLQIYRRISE